MKKPRLYVIGISHPSRAAELMLEHKGIEYERVPIPPGLQVARLPLARFSKTTVPALVIDGRRVQGSTAISRALDELQPDPPLFPLDTVRRRAVEEAEAWGDGVLQPIPRRLLRWAIRHQHSARKRFVSTLGVPAPDVAAWGLLPFGLFFARREDASSTQRILDDFAALPDHIERVDALIAEGTLGSETLNAADFQIATTLRVMLGCADYEPIIAGHPAEALALRVWPDYRYRLPPLIPR